MSSMTFFALLLYALIVLLRVYIWFLMLRVLLQLVHADYFNPFCRIIMRFTRFPLKYCRRRYWRGVEIWPLAFIVVAQVLKMVVVHFTFMSHAAPLDYILVGVLGLVRQLCNLYFYILIITAIASWVAIKPHPAIIALNQLIAPLLRPLQRVIPPIKGIDFTPLIWLVMLQVFDMYFLMAYSAGF